MMMWYYKLTIAYKVRLLLLIATLVGIICFSGIYTYYGMLSQRAQLLKETEMTADLIGSRFGASLNFNNPEFADKKLAGLNLDKSYTNICIYNENGDVFAHFPETKKCFVQHLLGNGAFEDKNVHRHNVLIISKTILDDGQVIGAIRIERSEDSINDYWHAQAKTMSAVAIASLVLCALVGNYLQKMISGPIVEFTKNARNIAIAENPQYRFAHNKNRELSQVVQAFNNALDIVQNEKIEATSSYQNIKRAHEAVLGKLKEIVSEFKDPAESFLAYSRLNAEQVLGLDINEYSPYRNDVKDALETYQLKIHTFESLTAVYARSIEIPKRVIGLKEYIARYMQQLKYELSSMIVDKFGQLGQEDLRPEILVYKEAWDRIFLMYKHLVTSINEFINFPLKIEFLLSPNSTELIICLMDQQEKHPTANVLLNLCELTHIDEDAPYKYNSIDDHDMAEEFLDEELLKRPDFKFILDSIAYIANANNIVVRHRFEARKFILYLELEEVQYRTSSKANLRIC